MADKGSRKHKSVHTTFIRLLTFTVVSPLPVRSPLDLFT